MHRKHTEIRAQRPTSAAVNGQKEKKKQHFYIRKMFPLPEADNYLGYNHYLLSHTVLDGAVQSVLNTRSPEQAAPCLPFFHCPV